MTKEAFLKYTALLSIFEPHYELYSLPYKKKKDKAKGGYQMEKYAQNQKIHYSKSSNDIIFFHFRQISLPIFLKIIPCIKIFSQLTINFG